MQGHPLRQSFLRMEYFVKIKNYIGEEYLIILKYIYYILSNNESKLKTKCKISYVDGGKMYMCAQNKKRGGSQKKKAHHFDKHSLGSSCCHTDLWYLGSKCIRFYWTTAMPLEYILSVCFYVTMAQLSGCDEAVRPASLKYVCSFFFFF